MQMEMTEAFWLKMYQWRIENKTYISRFWFGPFDVAVHLSHPKHLKKLLNGMVFFSRFSKLEV